MDLRELIHNLSGTTARDGNECIRSAAAAGVDVPIYAAGCIACIRKINVHVSDNSFVVALHPGGISTDCAGIGVVKFG